MENENIVALGVGRLGCQVVEHMLGKIDGVDFADIRFNAEPNVLGLFNAPLKFNVQSEDECKTIIGENFKHADIIFIIGDSLLAPCAAKAAKELGILTIGICFSSDEEFQAAFKEASDAVIRLDKYISLQEYIDLVDLARNAVKSITDLMTKSGFINLEFEDVKSILQDTGTAFIATGHAEGDNRAKIAALQAVYMFRRYDTKRVLLNITTGFDASLGEMLNAAEVIEEATSPDGQVIWGHVIDDNIGDDLQVTLIAGLDDK